MSKIEDANKEEIFTLEEAVFHEKKFTELLQPAIDYAERIGIQHFICSAIVTNTGKTKHFSRIRIFPGDLVMILSSCIDGIPGQMSREFLQELTEMVFDKNTSGFFRSAVKKKK